MSEKKLHSTTTVLSEEKKLVYAKKIIENIAKMFNVSVHNVITNDIVLTACIDSIKTSAAIVGKNINEKEQIHRDARDRLVRIKAEMEILQKETIEIEQYLFQLENPNINKK